MSYIDKDATLAAIAQKAKDELADVNHYFREGVQLTVDVVEGMPEAQPERKRGRWIAVTEDDDVYKRICSCCGREAFFQNDDPDELYDGGRYELSDFCPHCGADMRG